MLQARAGDAFPKATRHREISRAAWTIRDLGQFRREADPQLILEIYGAVSLSHSETLYHEAPEPPPLKSYSTQTSSRNGLTTNCQYDTLRSGGSAGSSGLS